MTRTATYKAGNIEGNALYSPCPECWALCRMREMHLTVRLFMADEMVPLFECANCGANWAIDLVMERHPLAESVDRAIRESVDARHAVECARMLCEKWGLG